MGKSLPLDPAAGNERRFDDAADRGAPRNFAGKADNPISQILQNADIGWTASRGPIVATGAQDVLSLATPLTGTLNVTGSLSAKATGAVGDALGGLLGGNVAKQIGSVNIKNLNASAEIKGNVVISARPQIAAIMSMPRVRWPAVRPWSARSRWRRPCHADTLSPITLSTPKSKSTCYARGPHPAPARSGAERSLRRSRRGRLQSAGSVREISGHDRPDGLG